MLKLNNGGGSCSYRVEAEAVCIGDAEGIVFVCEDDDIRDGVDTQCVVVGPEHRTDVHRQRSQVALRQDGLHKLGHNHSLESFKPICNDKSSPS